MSPEGESAAPGCKLRIKGKNRWLSSARPPFVCISHSACSCLCINSRSSDQTPQHDLYKQGGVSSPCWLWCKLAVRESCSTGMHCGERKRRMTLVFIGKLNTTNSLLAVRHQHLHAPASNQVRDIKALEMTQLYSMQCYGERKCTFSNKLELASVCWRISASNQMIFVYILCLFLCKVHFLRQVLTMSWIQNCCSDIYTKAVSRCWATSTRHISASVPVSKCIVCSSENHAHTRQQSLPAKHSTKNTVTCSLTTSTWKREGAAQKINIHTRK